MKFIYSAVNNFCLLCARNQAECWGKYAYMPWTKPAQSLQLRWSRHLG